MERAPRASGLVNNWRRWEGGACRDGVEVRIHPQPPPQASLPSGCSPVNLMINLCSCILGAAPANYRTLGGVMGAWFTSSLWEAGGGQSLQPAGSVLAPASAATAPDPSPARWGPQTAGLLREEKPQVWMTGGFGRWCIKETEFSFSWCRVFPSPLLKGLLWNLFL